MSPVPDATDFLATITGVTKRDLPPGTRLATIDPAYSSATLLLPKVTFYGESTLSVKQYPVISSYAPVAGDRVLMVPSGHTYVIIGSVASSSAAAATQPKARAHLTGTQTALHDPSLPGTFIGWAAGSNGTVDYTSQITWNGNHLFTLLVAGIYRITGVIIFSANNVGLRHGSVYINGAQGPWRLEPTPTSGNPARCEMTDELVLAAGTTVGLVQYQNSGSSLTLQGGTIDCTHLSILRVG